MAERFVYSPAYLRAMSVVANQEPEPALASLRALREVASGSDALLVDLLSVQTFLPLGRFDSAQTLFDDVVLGVEEVSMVQLDRLRVEATICLVRGHIAMSVQRDFRASAAEFEEAGAIAESIGDTWLLGAAEVNRAIAIMQQGHPLEGLELLDSASRHSELGAPSEELVAARRRMIDHNRASGLLYLREQGAVEALVNVRRDAVEANDDSVLARVDRNLAAEYLRQRQFGSAFQAASSAVDAYAAAGMEEDSVFSKVQVSEALVGMHRTEGVEAFLSSLLQRKVPNNEPPPAWREYAQRVLEELRRIEEPDVYHGMGASSGPSATVFEQAMDQIGEFADEAIRGAQRGVYRSPPAELQSLVETFEAWDGPDATGIVRAFAAIVSSLYEGTAVPEPPRETRAALARYGLSQDMLDDLVHAARLIQSPAQHNQFAFALTQVADHQLSLGLQETEADRGTIHQAVAGAITRALNLSLVLGEAEATFELLEASRRDLSEWREGVGMLPMAAFPELAHAAEGVSKPDPEATRNALGTPPLLTVRGKSALSRVRPKRARGAEAVDVLAHLAGPEAVWLSMRVQQRDIVWAYVSREETVAGSTPIDEDFSQAWTEHLTALPIARELHARIAGPRSPRWVVDLVATAVAADGPLVKRPNIVEACMSALPGVVAARLSDYLDSRVAPARDVYREIGRKIIPEPLQEWLSQPGVESRQLVVSVPPEFDVMPFPILDLGNLGLLGELAVVGFAPPIAIAGAMSGRAGVRGPLRTTVGIHDPADDLGFAARSRNDPWVATGWSAAGLYNRPATTENVLCLMEDASARGPYALAYVGHVRAGTGSRPGDSALLLSPKSPGEPPEFFTARQLLSSDVVPPRQAYLGGCESTGFGTGMEWASFAGALLATGSELVAAHAWPIIDSEEAWLIDKWITDQFDVGGLRLGVMARAQRRWIQDWQSDPAGAVPPHHWAGLNFVGRVAVEE